MAKRGQPELFATPSKSPRKQTSKAMQKLEEALCEDLESMLLKSDEDPNFERMAKRGQPELFVTPSESSRKQTGKAIQKLEALCEELGGMTLKPHGDLTFESPWAPMTPTSPAAAGSVPSANDEQIVNTALVLFLNSTTMHHPKVRVDWVLQRKIFRFSDLFEARTDGFLRMHQSDKVGAILEVKAYLRQNNMPQIQMQESAQMAAWIFANPGDDEPVKGKTTMR
jgi:hypothetical protein